MKTEKQNNDPLSVYFRIIDLNIIKYQNNPLVYQIKILDPTNTQLTQ